MTFAAADKVLDGLCPPKQPLIADSSNDDIVVFLFGDFFVEPLGDSKRADWKIFEGSPKQMSPPPPPPLSYSSLAANPSNGDCEDGVDVWIRAPKAIRNNRRVERDEPMEAHASDWELVTLFWIIFIVGGHYVVERVIYRPVSGTLKPSSPKPPSIWSSILRSRFVGAGMPVAFDSLLSYMHREVFLRKRLGIDLSWKLSSVQNPFPSVGYYGSSPDELDIYNDSSFEDATDADGSSPRYSTNFQLTKGQPYKRRKPHL
ncbi:hypothetical protein BGZ97_004184 [Linnemannia gamsii]|uniref:Uncharacterized protein n=1 Tax=Linnemannia gamsii TaxID=64522 RepID=A0A9P6QW60_9FUNG|nr:hypothetical protein BGZ97_004184 [Linnemannia gamsii]